MKLIRRSSRASGRVRFKSEPAKFRQEHKLKSIHKPKRIANGNNTSVIMENFLQYVSYFSTFKFGFKIPEHIWLKTLSLFVFRERFVQRAGAEALHINCYELEAEGF